MVQMESMISGHTFNKIRDRLADKLEVIRFDPYSKFPLLFRCVFILKRDYSSSERLRL